MHVKQVQHKGMPGTCTFLRTAELPASPEQNLSLLALWLQLARWRLLAHLLLATHHSWSMRGSSVTALSHTLRAWLMKRWRISISAYYGPAQEVHDGMREHQEVCMAHVACESINFDMHATP